MNKYLNRIIYEKGIYIFDVNDHIFMNTKYDDIIGDVLKKCIHDKSKWDSQIN